MHTFGSEDKPEIDYPCGWSYKLIGREEAALRAAVDTVVQGDYSLVHSRESTGGKYLSLELSLTVSTEEERCEIGRRLHEHEAVIYVF